MAWTKNAVIALAGIALIAARTPEEQAGTDMRPTDLTLTSALPAMQIETCLIRLLQRTGRVTPLPIEGGKAFDFQPKSGTVFGPGKNLMTFELRDAADVRSLTALYRHPLSKKGASNLLRDAGKRCLPDEAATP